MGLACMLIHTKPCCIQDPPNQPTSELRCREHADIRKPMKCLPTRFRKFDVYFNNLASSGTPLAPKLKQWSLPFIKTFVIKVVKLLWIQPSMNVLASLNYSWPFYTWFVLHYKYLCNMKYLFDIIIFISDYDVYWNLNRKWMFQLGKRRHIIWPTGN